MAANIFFSEPLDRLAPLFKEWVKEAIHDLIPALLEIHNPDPLKDKPPEYLSPVEAGNLLGGVAATVLWEVTRHVLGWYYATVSQIQVVYGTLATSVGVLLSAEFGAIVLLAGAQVIAEYERGLRSRARARRRSSSVFA